MTDRVEVNLKLERAKSKMRDWERKMGKRPPLPAPVIFATAKRRSVQLSSMGFTVSGRGFGD